MFPRPGFLRYGLRASSSEEALDFRVEVALDAQLVDAEPLGAPGTEALLWRGGRPRIGSILQASEDI